MRAERPQKSREPELAHDDCFRQQQPKIFKGMSKAQADKAIDAANRQLAYDFLDISRLAEDVERAEMDLKGLLVEREQLQRDEELSLIKQQYDEKAAQLSDESRQNWRFMSG